MFTPQSNRPNAQQCNKEQSMQCNTARFINQFYFIKQRKYKNPDLTKAREHQKYIGLKSETLIYKGRGAQE
jgi:hypothetical protein